MKKLTAQFELEEPKKHSKRFKEIPEDGEEAILGTVYVKNSALKKLDDPERLVLTITAP